MASADEQLSTELAPYHKLDFRVSYKWSLWGLRVGGFLDILNVYNRKNTIQFIFEEATLDVQGQEVGIERDVFDAPQLPRIIYFGLTLEVLKTSGFMVNLRINWTVSKWKNVYLFLRFT